MRELSDKDLVRGLWAMGFQVCLCCRSFTVPLLTPLLEGQPHEHQLHDATRARDGLHAWCPEHRADGLAMRPKVVERVLVLEAVDTRL